MSARFEAIVAGSHLRYDGVWQRPQHLLARLARHVPVLLVEEPFTATAEANEYREHDALTVLRPLRKRPEFDGVDMQTLEAVRMWLGERSALFWLTTPMMLPLADLPARTALVYDCMDELSAFRFAPPALAQRERDLLREADLVFAGGRTLYENRRAYGEKVRLYPSGVDFAFFASAQRVAAHRLFTPLERPIAGYFGVIDERIDLEILAALAGGPLQTVMIGPLAKLDPRDLPRSPHLHFTGQIAYERLPAFLAGFDVAIMPFARNEATRSISPTKTPEYLAGRKPVVSTPLTDVVSDYGDVVRFAQRPADFVDACLRAAASPDSAVLESGESLARQAGWDEIAAAMWADLRRL